MENFTRVDIFDTKGTEYLFVIGYLIILIVFWNIIKNPRAAIEKIKHVVSTISAGILRIPQGLFFSKYHTWTHLEKSGDAKVGVDDFLQHVTGKVNFESLKEPGEIISKGDLMAEMVRNNKQLKVYSPISGEITDTNRDIAESPDIVNSDPYEDGWIYRIKPTGWIKETNSYFLGQEAIEWSASELDRFKQFLTKGPMKDFSEDPSMIILQDGGEIRENVLSDLPDEVWNDFQNEFLNSVK
jgi:glycine cleavage system H protein